MIDAPPSATMEVSVVLGLLTFLFIYTHYRKQLAHTIANVTRYIMAQNISLNALFLNLVILIAHTINLFFYITLFLPIKGIETLYDNVSSASQRFKRLHMDPRLLILRLVRAPTKAFTMILDYTEYSLLFLPLMIMDWVVVTYCESDLHWSRNGYTGVTKTLLIPIWMIVLFVNVFFYCFWFMPALVLERVWGFFFEGVYEYDEAVAPNLGPVVTSPVTPRAVTFEERKNAVWDTDRTIMPTKSHRKPSLAKTEAISELDLNETNGEQCPLKEVTEELRARIKSWRESALGLIIDTSDVDDESADGRSFDSAIVLESSVESHITEKTDKHDDSDSAVGLMTPVEHEQDLAAGLVDAAGLEDHLDILEADESEDDEKSEDNEESEVDGERGKDMKTNERYFEFGFEDGPDVVERMMPGRMAEKVANADFKKNVS
jgi:hypothetical protein